MQTQVNPIINFIPLLIIYVILAICMTPVAKRKGKKIWLNWVMCFIPIINAFWIITTISLTDEEVKKEHKDSTRAIRRSYKSVPIIK